MAKKTKTKTKEPAPIHPAEQENIPLNLRSSMQRSEDVVREPEYIEELVSPFPTEIPYEVLEPISLFNTRCEQNDLTFHAGRHAANIAKEAIAYIDEHILGGFQKSLTALHHGDESLRSILTEQVNRSVNSVTNALRRTLEGYEQNITRHDTPKFYRGFNNQGLEFLIENLIDCGLISVPKNLSVEKRRRLHKLPPSIKKKLNLDVLKLPHYLTEDEQATLSAYEEGHVLLLDLIDWIEGIKEIPIETQMVEVME